MIDLVHLPTPTKIFIILVTLYLVYKFIDTFTYIKERNFVREVNNEGKRQMINHFIKEMSK